MHPVDGPTLDDGTNARSAVGGHSLEPKRSLSIERDQLADNLRLSEQRYRRLFESAKDGILILDTCTGAILDANPFLVDLLGYRLGELLGKELWQIGLFEDIEASTVALSELRRTGYIRYEDLPLETSDGRRIDVEFVSNVYGEGEQQVIQCNIRDITERRRMESTVQKQVADLAQANRHKDEFLAMLSHELRNPLGAILNTTSALRLQQVASPIQAAAHALIERQALQLSHLVSDLLEISRVTAGRIELNRERVEAQALVERGVDTVRPLIAVRRQELTLAFPDQPIWLNADPMRLEQVLVNLLTNAAKYTNQGGHLTVTVQLAASDVLFSVRDTGVGISADVLPRVFDLFIQADHSLARSQGGLGVGLTLVRRLVELHGGTVEARSAGLGHGSEFVVRLPVAGAALQSPAATKTATVEDAGRPLRILVVDDNKDSADSLSVLLQMANHRVRVVHSGPAALKMAVDFRPEVVLLDLGLPGFDGYEVARHLRARSVLGRVAIIAVTGYGQESDRERSEDAGFDFHLLKPVDWVKLQQLLETVDGMIASGR